ncbi:aldehyde dehydrogenase [Paraburkholderia monticola]|uniref:Aldehyde dehydrogenase n=1 Tax=Paraburkholderia monticola TaxID=1399968 RepID=A0A149PKI7_9BURK|nr:aldehyde dehydrogenase family protein [Paraburkholderia monticola]KXU85550.1 aldehyde dehydrogenase [Paraburkholderia monticola]
MQTLTTPTTTLLPEVSRFLDSALLGGVVGGRDVTAADGASFDTLDPGTGERLATVTAMSAADVDRAVVAANEAFARSGWATMPVNERAVWLHRLADEVEKRKSIIGQIEALDAGKVEQQAQGDVQVFVDTMRYFNNLSQNVQRRSAVPVSGYEAWTTRQPWGACGFIVPWNFPLVLIGWNISPALAAGNTVVIKPAEDTPLSAIYLAQLAREIGFPDGVINVVTGYGETAGAALAGHPGLRRMSFTGSPEVGRLVAEACGRNLVPCKLELGGKGAAVVFDDVDIEDTANKLARAITFHSGQVCCDATRWLVQESIYERFVDASVAALQRTKVGYQLDAGTQMGPVVSAKQRERVLGYLERGRQEGAHTVLEGGVASVPGRGGFYLKPALLAGALGNVAARDEIFGPVAYLAPFKDESQAVELANCTDYGLANSVWSRDLTRASRVAEAMVAGNSWINAHNLFPLGVPYAGVNKSGMGGGVNSVETLFDYWRSQSMVRPLS